MLLGCPSAKIVLKQREESNIFILHLLTIQYEIGKHIQKHVQKHLRKHIQKHVQKHEKLHKDATDITIPLFVAANPKFL